MAKFLSTSALDADTLKSNFIQYLKTQDNFKDYEFSGSNLSVLIDLLVQNTMYNNHYLNMVGAEGFLDTAELRESIVSRAKELNYTPKSKTSARTTLTVTIRPTDVPLSITIPKGYKFTTTLNNQRFNFITTQNYVIQRSNNSYVLSGVEVFEGIPVVEYLDVLSTTSDSGITTYSSRFIMTSENIDTSSVEVYVTSASTRTQYTKASSLFGLNPESEVFFVQGYSANQYEIVFGDGVLGKDLTTGDVVEIHYRDTIGTDANGIKAFSPSTTIAGYGDISIVTELPSYGGSDREPNDSIKFNAVRHFQVQERAVTESDYKNLILTNFPEIQAVSAYGGELTNRYGKVIVSLKPHNSAIATTNLKNRIANFLNTKNISNEAIIQDLEYFYIQVNSIIRYAPNQTSLSSANVLASVTNSLLTENTDTNVFKQAVYNSTLSALIQAADTSIVANSTEITMCKRITPNIGVDNSIELSYDNELKTYGVLYQFPYGHVPTVKSSEFEFVFDSIQYTSWIEDNGNGSLGIYTLNQSDVKVLLTTIGTVDYTVGKLVFTFNPVYYNPYISIAASLQENDVIVNNNKYLLLDAADFNLSLVSVNA